MLPATVELRSDVLIRRLAHAAPKSIPENRPLVRDGLPLEDALTGEGHGLFSERLCSGALSCCRERSRAAAITC